MTNTQIQLSKDKLTDIELRLSDKPTGDKYVRHAYIKNRYVGTIVGSKCLYYIHFNHKIKKTAIWVDVWVILQKNFIEINTPLPDSHRNNEVRVYSVT